MLTLIYYLCCRQVFNADETGFWLVIKLIIIKTMVKNASVLWVEMK